MSTELATSQNQNAVTAFPSRSMLPGNVNQGAVSIEQERAIAETQGQLILAKRFPRDLNQAYVELLESCKLPALAKVAFYAVPRGGSTVSGPSIRLAEEIARVYGNFEYGHRELARTEGKSEVEVYAWDKERNNRSIRQITVEHVRDTKNGPMPLRDQKDIDDKIANVASKQVRGRILALLPKWMVEAAIDECKKTIAGTNDEPITERVRKMTVAFSKLGVSTDVLERHLGHALGDVTVDELVDLLGIYNAIRDGAKASELFADAMSAQASETTASTIAAAAAAAQPPAAAAAPRRSARPQQPATPEPAAAAPAPATQPPAAQERNSVQPNSNPVKADSAPAAANTAAPADDEETF